MTQNRNIVFAGTIIVALGAGFILARLTAPTPPTIGAPISTTQTGGPAELALDASFLDVVGIKTEVVSAGNLGADILSPGTVTAAPNGQAVVTAHASGTIVRLEKQLGDSVRAGETLALVESREAATMAADRTVSESKAALARSALKREQELFDQRVTPRQELERAEAELVVAEAEFRRARDAANAAHVTPDGRIALSSPVTGRITATTATLGTFVQPDTELFRVADPQFIQVEAAVTAMDATRVAIGDAARITTLMGMHITATVRSVTPTLNEDTRSATVVLSLSAEHGDLSPGEIVQAIITPKGDPVQQVIVPEDAVQNVDGRNVVFVRTAKGFRVQPVAVGARSAGRVSVLSGLNAGDTIATANAFFLKAELAKGAGEDE